MGTSIIRYEGSNDSDAMEGTGAVSCGSEAGRRCFEADHGHEEKQGQIQWRDLLELEDWGTVARFYNCTAKLLKPDSSSTGM